MGLTICYELRLPGEMAEQDVGRILKDLRDHALTLPFADVGIIDGPFARGALAVFAEAIDGPIEPDSGDLELSEWTARGFVVVPGEGSEMATFAFMMRDNDWTPIYSPDGTEDIEAMERGDIPWPEVEAADVDLVSEWFWQCFCKTQYASNVSDEHFLTCHKSVVAMLDRAKELGVDVRVWDEGGYWETRDDAVLLAALRHSSHVLAAFAGHLRDAIGGAVELEAPILGHPDFEHLEMGEE